MKTTEFQTMEAFWSLSDHYDLLLSSLKGLKLADLADVGRLEETLARVVNYCFRGRFWLGKFDRFFALALGGFGGRDQYSVPMREEWFEVFVRNFCIVGS